MKSFRKALSKKLPFHYGWIIAAVGLVQIICACMFSNGISILLSGIRTELGFTGTETGMFMTVRALFGFLGVLVMDIYFKKLGVKNGILALMGLGAGAMVLFSFAGHTTFLYYIAMAMGGLVFGLGMMASISILMKRWFNKSLATALGICSCGTGFSSMIFSPILQSIINNRGISVAFLFAASIFVFAGVMAFVFYESDPADLGLEPVGGVNYIDPKKLKSAQDKATAPKVTIYVGTGALIFMSFCLAIMGMGSSPIGSHLAVTFNWEGIDSMVVATGASITGLCLIVGKFLFGLISDHIGKKFAAVLYTTIIVIGYGSIFAILFVPDEMKVPLMFAGYIGHGIGGSICTLGYPTWAADFVSAEDYPKTLKKFQTGFQLGTLVASPLPGIVCDALGSYCWYYPVAIIGYILPAAFALIVYASLNKKRKAAGEPTV